jgi:hypothetical protein
VWCTSETRRRHLACGSHTCKFEWHVRVRATGSWSSVGSSGVAGRIAIYRCPGRSDWTTVAAGGKTAVAELPNLWAARVGA